MNEAGASVGVVSVNVSAGKGTPKQPVEAAEIDANGLVGDAHAGPGPRQVSLLDLGEIEAFAAQTGQSIRPGEFAENLTVRGLQVESFGYWDCLRGDTLELEVTAFGKSCHGASCAIYQRVGRCVMPRAGLFCRVRRGGTIRRGDRLQWIPRPLRMRVITLSDRASQGVYPDRSGPLAESLLIEALRGRHWHPSVERQLIPDDAAPLRACLERAAREGADAVFTVGGTGVGPRDIAPEVVQGFCDKWLPGLMDAIRLRCGQDHPAALLSRSVAGVRGTLPVYALPGSERAVREYIPELMKTFEHLLFTVRGLDTHAG